MSESEPVVLLGGLEDALVAAGIIPAPVIIVGRSTFLNRLQSASITFQQIVVEGWPGVAITMPEGDSFRLLFPKDETYHFDFKCYLEEGVYKLLPSLGGPTDRIVDVLMEDVDSTGLAAAILGTSTKPLVLEVPMALSIPGRLKDQVVSIPVERLKLFPIKGECLCLLSEEREDGFTLTHDVAEHLHRPFQPPVFDSDEDDDGRGEPRPGR